ncbi:MAG TPA: bacteriophage holin, partial [Candidatus Tripitaka sp. YC43]
YCLILGLIAMSFGCGTALLEMIGSYYIGYKPTLLGSLVGGVWGLIDGFICGAVVAWVYNKLTAT